MFYDNLYFYSSYKNLILMSHVQVWEGTNWDRKYLVTIFLKLLWLFNIIESFRPHTKTYNLSGFSSGKN